SPGSKYFGVSVMCTPHVSCPSGTAAAGVANSRARSSNAGTAACREPLMGSSLRLELQGLSDEESEKLPMAPTSGAHRARTTHDVTTIRINDLLGRRERPLSPTCVTCHDAVRVPRFWWVRLGSTRGAVRAPG